MNLVKKWYQLTLGEKAIICIIFSLFLPFYFSLLAMALLIIVLACKKQLMPCFREIKGAWGIVPFVFLNALVSLYYHNGLGFGCSIAIFLVFSVILYYQRHVSNSLFELIMEIMIFMSIFCALYGMIEYHGVLKGMGIEKFEIMIFDLPKDRLNSVFFTANYYAMMIEFFCLMAYYKLLKHPVWQRCLYYLFVIGLNLFVLYLTACRTAWPSLCAGIFVLTLLSRNKKLIAAVFVIGVIFAILFLSIPDLFPRADNIADYYESRQLIWKISMENIAKHPLFGEGPLTYNMIWSLYPGGFETQHAHSLYIDPFLSHGLVGVVLIAPYFIARAKDLMGMIKSQDHFLLVGLVLGTITTTLCHGFLDYTVFFVQTGFTFLLIIGSMSAFKQSKNEPVGSSFQEGEE